jgi:uncharacterized membrane protein YhdT
MNDERYIQNVQESSFHFWQSILTVNGLLMAAVLASISFIANKDLIQIPVFSLIGSSLLIILNFQSIREVYKKIAKLKEEDLARRKENISFALREHYKNKKREELALILTLLSIISFLIIASSAW